MFHYSEPVVNLSGDALVGYFGRVIDMTTGGVITIAADNAGTPIATVSGQTNMAKTDSGGLLTFYVAPGNYHLDVYGPDAITFIKRYTDQPMGDATAAAAAVATAADRVQTGLDRTQTGLDRVQTGLDRVATGADVTTATAARDAASVAGKVFADTTTGLANSSGTGSTNRYFGVPSTDGTFITEYRNDAGVATLINTYPSLSGLAASINVPNGTRQRWLDLLAAAGTSASATVQAAALDLEQQLKSSGLLPKIVRLNMRWGTGAAAARIPFVQRPGCGFASDTGTISSWTEATGLTGATLDTGVTLQQFGGAGFNLGLGFLSPTELGNAASGLLVGGTSIGWGLYNNIANTYAAFLNTFDNAGQIRANRQRDVGGGGSGASYTVTTAGFTFGSRLPSGDGFIAYNGFALPAVTTVPDPALSVGPPTDTVKINTTVMTSWGDVITDGLTQAEAAMLYNSMKRANIAIGRTFVAEGTNN